MRAFNGACALANLQRHQKVSESDGRRRCDGFDVHELNADGLGEKRSDPGEDIVVDTNATSVVKQVEHPDLLPVGLFENAGVGCLREGRRHCRSVLEQRKDEIGTARGRCEDQGRLEPILLLVEERTAKSEKQLTDLRRGAAARGPQVLSSRRCARLEQRTNEADSGLG